MPNFDDRAVLLYKYINTLMEELVVSNQAFIKTDAAELNLQERKAIDFLGRHPQAIMSELAAYLGVPLSTMTGIVDKLCRKKLVSRNRSEVDRRIVELHLTADGERNYQEEREKFKQWSRAMLGRLSASEQESMLTILGKIVKRT